MTGNVTIDPTARAIAVADAEIQEVRNLRSGQILSAPRLIGRVRYDRFVRLRSQIKEAVRSNRPRIACAICGASVFIAASTNKAFFFRHRTEDGSCPAQTRFGLTNEMIRAMKYRGIQESEAHKNLKSLIVRSLQADKRFTGILVEKTWRGERNPELLRRPDVRAALGNLRIAFEAQLTTTFLDVVIGRKSFYRSEGALLVWVLPYFDPTYRRMMIDDVLFNNNSNVLIVDRATTEASEAEGRFMVRCEFRRPLMENWTISSVWESELVPWDRLTIDQAGQRAYLFDTEGEERTLISKYNFNILAAKEEEDQILRDDLLTIVKYPDKYYCDERGRAFIYSLCDRFRERGLRIPGAPHLDERFRTIAAAIVSALDGEIRGFRFKKLIQIAHHLADNYPEGLIFFFKALRISGNHYIIEHQDKSNRWKIKANSHRDRAKEMKYIYKSPDEITSIIEFLFPILTTQLKRSAD